MSLKLDPKKKSEKSNAKNCTSCNGHLSLAPKVSKSS